MGDIETGLPIEALEDVEYLSRSANRVVILDALTQGSSARRELEEATGVSRTTLDRIINELESRGWAERTTDGTYVATPAGTHLLEQFRPVLNSFEALRQLDDAIEWLPLDELEIGLEHFSDASVRLPKEGDPVEGVEYMTTLVRDASEFRTLTHLVPPTSLLQAMRDEVVSGRLTVEAVSSQVDTSEQSSRRELWRDMLESGAEFYRCDGPLPCNLWIIDETVLIKKSRPGSIEESYGAPIVSANSTVRSWAHDLIDRYRADAAGIDVEIFTESPAQSGDL